MENKSGLIKDYTDERFIAMAWDELCSEVRKQFSVENADCIAIKVIEYIGEEERGTYYEICNSNNFCSVLQDILERSDCKNGCQLYTNHFQITGGGWFNTKTNKDIGFSIAKVYFKEVVWTA